MQQTFSVVCGVWLLKNVDHIFMILWLFVANRWPLDLYLLISPILFIYNVFFCNLFLVDKTVKFLQNNPRGRATLGRMAQWVSLALTILIVIMINLSDCCIFIYVSLCLHLSSDFLDLRSQPEILWFHLRLCVHLSVNRFLWLEFSDCLHDARGQ